MEIMISTDFFSGQISGDAVRTTRTVADLALHWTNREQYEIQKGKILYETESWFPHPDGTEGAVLWASTKIFPGKVGDQHFMTRGHWHLKPTHGELIIVASGTGELVLKSRDGTITKVALAPGVTFHINGDLAHRTINTGTDPLIFWCAWPADCGHDYSDPSLIGEWK
jgi:glucose-6-phosphate isomerase, archaeal